MSYSFNIPFKVERAAPPGPTWEWIDGYSFAYNRMIVEDPDWSILEAYLPVTPGGSITWRWAQTGSGTNRAIIAYDNNKVAKDYWGNITTSGQRTVSLSNYPSFVFFRMCCLTSDKDYSFFRDDTTGEYLYKGKFVE